MDIFLKLPDKIAERVRTLAENNQRSVEELLLDWIDRSATEPPIDQLPDAEVLMLVNLQFDSEDDERLSELLYDNQNGALTDETRQEFDALMKMYREGMVRKAKALHVATQRGLLPPLDEVIVWHGSS